MLEAYSSVVATDGALAEAHLGDLTSHFGGRDGQLGALAGRASGAGSHLSGGRPCATGAALEGSTGDAVPLSLVAAGAA